MSDIKCPCEECICVPICRHKKHPILFGNCSLIRNYVSDWSSPKHRDIHNMCIVHGVLKPTKWKFEYNEKIREYPLILPIDTVYQLGREINEKR